MTTTKTTTTSTCSTQALRKSLDFVFRPRGIAVIGVGRQPTQIGHLILNNLIKAQYTGPVYPINPHAEVVRSMHCYKSVKDVPGIVDLAVIVVPAKYVIDSVKECAAKGVKGLVIITAGFAEIGGAGTALQAELEALCAKHGIRVVGPNCMGILNMEPAIQMNASFASTRPDFGGVCFVSQSGALGEAILSDAHELGIGINMFVSVANRIDISPADLLRYWGDDPNCHQILMYLESFGNPSDFMDAARCVTRKKPVLVVKSGRSAKGAQAAISHTGSLAGSEAAADALLQQCGILRVDSMKELFSLAAVTQVGKFPRGRRVGIVTNAGGPAILATDACEAQGLEIVDLSEKTTAKIEAVIPVEASAKNPVDLIASADGKRYDKVLGAMLADKKIDMVIAIFVSPAMIDSEAVAQAFAKHANRSKKPVVTCLLGRLGKEAALDVLRESGVPNYRFPEEAVSALAGLADLEEMHSRPNRPAEKFRVNKKKARDAVEQALSRGRNMLKGTELETLFTSYGIPMVPSRIVLTLDEALKFAKKVGYPVVAKIESAKAVHKSDFGGVRLDLRTPEDLKAAYGDLKKRFHKIDKNMKVMVQAMRSGGIETFFGAAPDPQYGRLQAFGLGGIHVEVFKDVVFRLHPLSRLNAEVMVDGIRAKALLEGARGKPPVDREQLIEISLRLSQMLTDLPEIVELDLNPFLAAWDASESCVLDCRVRLEKPATK